MHKRVFLHLPSAALLMVLVGGTALAALSCGAQKLTDRVAEVDPLIGTSNGGNVFPGVTLPFGMVQFSP